MSQKARFKRLAVGPAACGTAEIVEVTVGIDGAGLVADLGVVGLIAAKDNVAHDFQRQAGDLGHLLAHPLVAERDQHIAEIKI